MHFDLCTPRAADSFWKSSFSFITPVHLFDDAYWPLVLISVYKIVIIAQLKAPLVYLNTAKGAICKRNTLACAGLTFYLCNENVECYSFVVLGNIPKSYWAGMIIEESCDWDKWSPNAQCTVTIYQPQAAGMLLQRGLMEEIVRNLFPSSLPAHCTQRRANMSESDWLRLVKSLESSPLYVQTRERYHSLWHLQALSIKS